MAGFLPLQKQRLVFLIHPEHPLSAYASLSIEDLQGQSVALVEEGRSQGVDRLRALIAASGMDITIKLRDANQVAKLLNGIDLSITTGPEGIAQYFSPLIAVPMAIQGVTTDLGLMHTLDPPRQVVDFLNLAAQVNLKTTVSLEDIAP
jgi:hypothetical protein